MNLRDALNLHRVDRKPTTGLPDVITNHPRFRPSLGLDGGQIGSVRFWRSTHRVGPDGSLFSTWDDYDDMKVGDDPDWDDLPTKDFVTVRGGLVDYARIEIEHIEKFAALLLREAT